MALNPALRALVTSANAKYKSNTGDTVKPKQGRTTWRIIAPTPQQAAWVPASMQFWADLGINWIKASENGKPIVVMGDSEVCYGTPSVVSTAIAMAIESAMDEESKKLAESFRARKSVLLNAIDRTPGSPTFDQVVPLELTATTFGKFLEQVDIYAAADQDICANVGGSDIVIIREGTGLQTEYTIMVAPGVSKPVTAEHMSKVIDLPAFIKTKYFRGEEQKALNAIQQIFGIAVPTLGAPARTPTAALTSSAASVADAKTVDPAPVDNSAAAEAAAAEAAAKAAAKAAKLRKMQEEMAAFEAEDAAPAAPPAPAAGAASTNVSGLSSADEEAILAELDNLAN